MLTADCSSHFSCYFNSSCNIVGHYLLVLCTLKLLFILNQLLEKTLYSELRIRCFLTCWACEKLEYSHYLSMLLIT
jgi:hypothetical protein